jgi:hypothetical protein
MNPVNVASKKKLKTAFEVFTPSIILKIQIKKDNRFILAAAALHYGL